MIAVTPLLHRLVSFVEEPYRIGKNAVFRHLATIARYSREGGALSHEDAKPTIEHLHRATVAWIGLLAILRHLPGGLFDRRRDEVFRGRDDPKPLRDGAGRRRFIPIRNQKVVPCLIRRLVCFRYMRSRARGKQEGEKKKHDAHHRRLSCRLTSIDRNDTLKEAKIKLSSFFREDKILFVSKSQTMERRDIAMRTTVGAVAAFVVLFFAACGEEGISGKNSLVKTSDVEAGDLCAEGGIKIESGLDENRNGVLDPEEVKTWQVICNGAAGAGCTVTEEDGTKIISCDDGSSVTVHDGKDGAGCTMTDNHDGSHTITCDGVAVTVRDGANGSSGHSSLVVIEEAPEGTCPNGGQKVSVGIDLDDDGTLDAEEITTTKYVCNGTDGHDSLVTVEPVGPGSDCATGGHEIKTGVDTNDNGVLDANEVLSDVFVCNGKDGSDGADGHHAMTEIVPLGAGEGGCAAGGYLFRMGVDENGNGALDAGEYDEATVCNGEKGDPGEDGVCAGNNPPVIESITLDPPDGIGGTYKINVPYSLVITASDANGDALAYQIVGGYASIEPGVVPGTFTVTPRAAGGPFSFAVIVSDGCQVTMGNFVITEVSADDTAPWFGDANLYFSDLSDSGFRVSWNPAFDNWTEQEDLEYKVVYAFTLEEIDTIEEIEAGGGTVAADWTTNMTTTLIAGLEQGVTYWVVVLVRDEYHLISMYNPGSQWVPDTTPPMSTAHITISDIVDDGFDIAWDAASDNLTPADLLEYRVAVSSDPTAIDTAQEVADLMSGDVLVNWQTMTFSASIDGLLSGVKYYVAVVVRDAEGNMLLYPLVSALTTGDTTPPEPVSNIHAIPLDKRVVFRWDDPDRSSDLTLDHVEITWSPNAPAEPVVVPLGAIVRAADGLTNGTAYTFSITAVDHTGNRSSEETITVTPADPGMAWAITGSSSTATKLYRLNPSTAKMTLIGDTGLTHVTSLAIHPQTGKGYLLRSTEWDYVYFGGTYEVDLATAQVTLIGSIGDTLYQNPDAAFSPEGVLYAWTENNDDLITVDLATGAGTRISDSNVGTWSTGLAFDKNGTLWVKPGNELWQLDLENGAGTYITDIDYPGGIASGDEPYYDELRNALDFSPETGVGFSVVRTETTTYLLAFTLDERIAIPVGDLKEKKVSAVEFRHDFVPVNQHFSGIKRFVPADQLTDWTVCHTDTYADSGTALNDILADCDGANLLLACRPVGSSLFTLAAWAKREDVLFDTGVNDTVVHNSNGVDWYFNDSWSWGFAPEGAGVNKNSCDYNDGILGQQESRLCWHTFDGDIDSGYRCGDNDLNDDNNWERVILQANF